MYICTYQTRACFHQFNYCNLSPPQINDVIFSLHAVFACVVTIAQCLVYDRGDQTVRSGELIDLINLKHIFNQQVSRYCKGFIGIAAVLLAVFVGLSVGAVVTWLTFVYVCSYVKLAITLIKYVPQV